MVRGLITGVGVGGILVVLGLGAASLMAPLPERPLPEAEPAPDATMPMASITEPDMQAGQSEPPEAEPAPTADAVDVPAESEFARVASDQSPERPAPGPTSEAGSDIAPGSPAAVDAPDRMALAGTEPPARPELSKIAPEPQPAPAPVEEALPQETAEEAAPPVETPMVAPAEADISVTDPMTAPVPEAPAPIAEPEIPETTALEPVAPMPATPVAEALPPEPVIEAPTPAPTPGPVDVPQPESSAPDRAEMAQSAPAAEQAMPVAEEEEKESAMPPAEPPAAELPAVEMPEEPAVEPVEEPEIVEEPVTPAKPRVITLTEPSSVPGERPGGFRNVDGVRTGRLPTIGARPQADVAEEDEPEASSATSEEPPIRRFAQVYNAPADSPLYSIVMVDPGVEAGGLDRDTIKALGIPVTIALDPMRSDAAEAAADFREEGFEVVILASGIPANANATDVEVALEAWRAAIPEAIAVVEAPQPVFQNRRNLVQPMLKILEREGLGIVSQDQGLNAAAQLAASANLPRSSVWRVVDEGRETGAAIERSLSRGAFEAQKSGAVTVMLSAWPETVAALTDWVMTAQGTVAFVPVSTVALRAQERPAN